jgi:hypothetical protein
MLADMGSDRDIVEESVRLARPASWLPLRTMLRWLAVEAAQFVNMETDSLCDSLVLRLVGFSRNSKRRKSFLVNSDRKPTRMLNSGQQVQECDRNNPKKD